MMRNLMLIALLATSAAMPAMAQDGQGRHRDRGEQNERSEARAERQAERRAERAQRPERAERPQVAERANWSERVGDRQRAVEQQAEHRTWDRRREEGTTGVTREMRRQRSSASDAQRAQLIGEQQQQQQRRYRDDRRRGERGILGQVIERSRERQGQVVDRRDDHRDGRYQPRSGTDRRWSNHWRQDRSYDWRHYRDRNRSVFRLGRYYDPYRYGYRRFSIGFSLFPSYYQSSYWLNDPWMYRLPPAYGPYRWVRYYNDALLVNIYTGQVVDVEYDFFW